MPSNRILMSITLDCPPDKTEYYEGEMFDSTGMVVTAHYSNGTSEDITSSILTHSYKLEAGMKSITIYHTEYGVQKSVMIPIIVHKDYPNTIVIVKQPNKTNYFEGEFFEPTGMKVEAVYMSGKKENIDDYTLQPEGPLTADDKEITVSYQYDGKIYTVIQQIKVEYPIMIEKQLTSKYVETGFYSVHVVNDKYQAEKQIGNIKFGKSETEIFVPEVKLNISSICKALNIEKSVLNVNELEVTFFGLKNIETQYHIYDKDYNLIDTYSPRVKNEGYLYVVPIGSLIKENIISNNIIWYMVPVNQTKEVVQLNVEDIRIKISYKDALSKYPVPITEEDRSKAEQEYGNNPKVNLFTGRLIYEHPDLSFGGNSYGINIVHIYNSALIDKTEQFEMGMGKGWKLNVQQYIRKIKPIENREIPYQYIDASGCTHILEYCTTVLRNNVEMNVYTDTEGLDITLMYPFRVEWDEYYAIKDASNNYILFNNSGQCVMMVSVPFDDEEESVWQEVSQGKANAIVFEYINGKLIQIYNQRNYNTSDGKKSYVEFEYREDGGTEGYIHKMILKSNTNSSVVQDIETLGYEYNKDGELIKITKTVGNNSKTIKRFNYWYGSKLNYILSEETKEAVKLKYDENYKVSKISNGYATDLTDFSTFVEKGYNSFIYVNHTDEYQAYLKQVIVENEKGISVVYNFNLKGEIVSSFEKLHPYKEIFRTMTMEPGKCFELPSEVLQENTINGYSSGFEADGLYIMGKVTPSQKGEEDTKNFMVNCYIRLDTFREQTLKAIINFNHNSYLKQFSVRIDNTAYKVWQKVSVPISLENLEKENLSEFSLGIYNMYGVKIAFTHTPLSFIPSTFTEIDLIRDKYYNVEFRHITTAMIQCEGKDSFNEEIGNIREVNYREEVFENSDECITYSDLLKTAQSLYLKKEGMPAFVYLNGGRKRYGNISSAKFTCVWDLPEGVSVLGEKGKCTVELRQIAPDNKTVTTTNTEFSQSGILTITQVKREDKISCTKTKTTYDGRILYKEDAYGIREEYSYDKYRNLVEVKKVKKDASNNIISEMIVQKNEYDNQSEYITGITSGYYGTEFNYKKPREIIDSVLQKQYDFVSDTYTVSTVNQRLEYDEYTEKLKNVSLQEGTTVQLKNEVTYEKGFIRTVSDGYSKYGVLYDTENDTITYTVFDEEQETAIHKRQRTYVTDSGNTIFSDTYYRGDETDTVKVTSDRYGKILSAADGNKTVNYEYTDEFNSSGFAYPISSIYDPYEDRTYKYNYNYDGEICGWEADNWLKMQQISANETKYVFNGFEKYKTDYIYDENVLIEPRILKTKVNVDSDKNNSDDWETIPITVMEYGNFDDLGRVTTKSNTTSPGEIIYFYEYKTNSNGTLPLISKCNYESNILKESYDHAALENRNNLLNSSYDYDERGNLISIEEDRERQDYYTEERKSRHRSITYQYGNINRIEKEIINENYGKEIRSYNYFYYSNGNGFGKIWKITDNQNSYNTKIYSYNSKGQMSGYTTKNTSYSYIYDNYGNVKSKTKDGATMYSCKWTKGNLLKQFTTNNTACEYFYNYKNIRYKKVVNGITTNYYLDGNKILGEDRSDGTRLRYFYDLDGLCGFRWNGTDYAYIKDGLGNIRGITDDERDILAWYDYDLYGNTKVSNPDGTENTDSSFIGNMNPFRWKSHYYDVESGLYNVDGRYYEIERCEYIDAMEADIITENAYQMLGLDRTGLMCLNAILLISNEATIATSIVLCTDPLYYNPETERSWWERNFLKIILGGIQIIAGIALVASGVGIGQGIGLIISGALSLLSPILNEQLVGAAGQAITGIQAIAIGVKMCNPIGALFTIVSGVCCIAFATAEAQESFGCGNWIKEEFGINDGWYTGLMIVSNIAATAGILYDQYGPKCFAAGTLILCRDESGKECYKRIEEIEVGDRVLAYNEETGEQAYKPVVRLFRNETKEWYHVFVNGEEIVCTGGHPFYVVGKGFIEARKLKVSEKLLLSSGKEVIIEKIEVETLTKAETTYNFEVADFHTYYVSEKAVLVHNKCKYYEATRTDGGIERGREITKKQALNRVRNGKDVLTSSRSSAKALAKNAFGNARAYSEIHSNLTNPMMHFHDMRNHFYHIFFGDNFI